MRFEIRGSLGTPEIERAGVEFSCGQSVLLSGAGDTYKGERGRKPMTEAIKKKPPFRLPAHCSDCGRHLSEPKAGIGRHSYDLKLRWCSDASDCRATILRRKWKVIEGGR